MTLLHILGLAAKILFVLGLWLCLMGLTYILMDLFIDWYAQFKQARKDKAAKKVAVPPATKPTTKG